MRRRLLLAVFLFLLFAGITAGATISLKPYVRIGIQVREVLQGEEQALTSEYPPLASAFFYVFQQNPFGLSFIQTWKALLLIALSVVLAYVFTLDERAPLHFLLALLLSVPLLGTELVFARYDILILFLLFFMWEALRHDRPLAAGLGLALAASLKLVPILILPFLWIPLRPHGRMRLLGGTALGFTIGLGIPLLLMGSYLTWENLTYISAYHGQRGLQIESTWSGLLLILAAVTRSTITIDSRQGAFELIGLPVVSLLATVLTVAGLAFLLWNTWRRSRADRGPPVTALIALPLLWALLMTPVLSPQYFVWILPLLLTEGIRQCTARCAPQDAVLILLTVCAAAITQWIFPVLYYELIHLSLWPVLILNLRNVCVLGLIVLLWREWRQESIVSR